MDFSTSARQNMVENQLKPQGIMNAALLEAMTNTPREDFVPEEYADTAYSDFDIPLTDTRFLFRPAEVARFIAAAELQPDDFVADIGCKLGYITFITAKMVKAVVGIESDKALADKAENALLEVDNAAIINTDMHKGMPKQAPFDVIFLEEIQTSAMAPKHFISQLADNGRLVFITGKAPILTVRLLIKKGEEVFEKTAYQFLLNPEAQIAQRV